MSARNGRWAAIAALVVSPLVATACSEPAQPRIFPAATTTAAAWVPGRYEMIPDLCVQFDRSAVQAILPFEERFTPKAYILSAACSGTMGPNEDHTGTVAITMEIDEDPRRTPIKFEALRRAQARYATIEPLEGIGQGAYQYIDPVLGPHAVVYDGNGYFDIRWGWLGSNGWIPDGLREALVESLRATMAKLRLGDLQPLPRSP